MTYFQRNCIAYKTIVLNEVYRTLRLWSQTILPSAITTVLYFLIFGRLMGQRIGSMAGIDYINFIMPGLIMMNMLMAAYNASIFVVYMAKYTRNIEEILVSPMTATSVLLAFLSVGIVRGLIVAIVVALVALGFTHYHINNIILMLFVAILGCAIFSLLAIINALYAKTFDQVSIVPTFVIMPLSYLGGVFYSISILPPFWQKLAFFDPIVYLISTFRYAFYGVGDIHVLGSLLGMLGVFVILFFYTLRLIKNRTGISD
ncbi:MAG: ABC transporter permease [Gammaproteobacteria bacterium]|nr:ABC transporter permease [Gammaproteobacteria bacterium]